MLALRAAKRRLLDANALIRDHVPSGRATAAENLISFQLGRWLRLRAWRDVFAAVSRLGRRAC